MAELKTVGVGASLLLNRQWTVGMESAAPEVKFYSVPLKLSEDVITALQAVSSIHASVHSVLASFIQTPVSQRDDGVTAACLLELVQPLIDANSPAKKPTYYYKETNDDTSDDS